MRLNNNYDVKANEIVNLFANDIFWFTKATKLITISFISGLFVIFPTKY